MAKKTTTVVIPKSKRLPQGNISRLMQILHMKVHSKAKKCLEVAAMNSFQACNNYMAATIKKHGLNSMATLKLNKQGHIVAELTAKVKNDLKRIKAPYESKFVNGEHVWVPANKLKEFETAAQNLQNLEILLLTADSDEALTMYDTAEQQIEGIK